MRTTAKAFVTILHQIQEQDTTELANVVNRKGYHHSFAIGDRVTFFIPPTAEQAQRAGRKVKHIAHYKGPAIVTAKLSTTTYAIKFHGKTYGRYTLSLIHI